MEKEKEKQAEEKRRLEEASECRRENKDASRNGSRSKGIRRGEEGKDGQGKEGDEKRKGTFQEERKRVEVGTEPGEERTEEELAVQRVSA